MTMTPVETLQKLYSHVRVGEWAEAEEYLSNDFVAYEPDTLPFGGEWSGENVLKRLFGTVMGSFDDPKVEPIDMSGGDEWVYYALNLSVTSKTTGKRSTYRIIENGRVIDGKLTELHLHYFDTGLMSQEIKGETS